MSQQPDDLEAVRILVTTLEKFNENEQERIIRWAREKLGLASTQQSLTSQSIPLPNMQSASPSVQDNAIKDLKTFVNEKNPTSDMQFAATVAYYYKFEAPTSQRKDSIDSEVLQDAARLAGRKRLSRPVQTLVNASFNGMLDKTEQKGSYKINTVGENLVAMTLPQSSTSRNQKRPAKKTTSKSIKKK